MVMRIEGLDNLSTETAAGGGRTWQQQQQRGHTNGDQAHTLRVSQAAVAAAEKAGAKKTNRRRAKTMYIGIIAAAAGAPKAVSSTDTKEAVFLPRRLFRKMSTFNTFFATRINQLARPQKKEINTKTHQKIINQKKKERKKRKI